MKTILISIGVLILLGAGIFFYNKNYSDSNIFTQEQPRQVAPDIKGQDDLHGEWMWEYSTDASGEKIIPKDASRFVLTLTSEGKLSSTTDCNGVGGSFIKNEEVISVGPLMSTEMACLGETLESIYVSQLALVSSYSISGDTLTFILVKDSGTMTFSRR